MTSMQHTGIKVKDIRPGMMFAYGNYVDVIVGVVHKDNTVFVYCLWTEAKVIKWHYEIRDELPEATTYEDWHQVL